MILCGFLLCAAALLFWLLGNELVEGSWKCVNTALSTPSNTHTPSSMWPAWAPSLPPSLLAVKDKLLLTRFLQDFIILDHLSIIGQLSQVILNRFKLQYFFFYGSHWCRNWVCFTFTQYWAISLLYAKFLIINNKWEVEKFSGIAFN